MRSAIGVVRAHPYAEMDPPPPIEGEAAGGGVTSHTTGLKISVAALAKSSVYRIIWVRAARRLSFTPPPGPGPRKGGAPLSLRHIRSPSVHGRAV